MVPTGSIRRSRGRPVAENTRARLPRHACASSRPGLWKLDPSRVFQCAPAPIRWDSHPADARVGAPSARGCCAFCALRPSRDLAPRNPEALRQIGTCLDVVDGGRAGERLGKKRQGTPTLLGHLHRPHPETVVASAGQAFALDEIAGCFVLETSIVTSHSAFSKTGRSSTIAVMPTSFRKRAHPASLTPNLESI